MKYFTKEMFAGFDFFYVKNIQGDVLKIVNPSGQTVVSFTYDAWGNFTLTPNSESDRTEITFAAAFNPIFYRGYIFDYETGLYYLKSRYYNPETGRFVNEDAYCDTQTSIISTNMFAYCANSPVSQIDPDGFYNRTNAVKYARKWTGYTNWNIIIFNPKFHFYINGDCANFVSQCINAGGIKMTNSWYSKGFLKRNISESWRLVSKQMDYFNQEKYCKGVSVSYFYDDDSKKDIANKLKTISNELKVGDVLYMDLIRNDETKYVHAAIITAIQNGIIYYAAHTSNKSKQNLADSVYNNKISQIYFLKLKDSAV